MPIAPDSLFIATKSEETRLNFLQQFERGELICRMNHLGTAQSLEFVYGDSTDALAVVEEGIGRLEAPTL